MLQLEVSHCCGLWNLGFGGQPEPPTSSSLQSLLLKYSNFVLPDQGRGDEMAREVGTHLELSCSVHPSVPLLGRVCAVFLIRVDLTDTAQLCKILKATAPLLHAILQRFAMD